MGKADEIARLLLELVEAMQRKDTDQDGNWGWPTFSEDLQRIKDELSALLEGNTE